MIADCRRSSGLREDHNFYRTKHNLRPLFGNDESTNGSRVVPSCPTGAHSGPMRPPTTPYCH